MTAFKARMGDQEQLGFNATCRRANTPSAMFFMPRDDEVRARSFAIILLRAFHEGRGCQNVLGWRDRAGGPRATLARRRDRAVDAGDHAQALHRSRSRRSPTRTTTISSARSWLSASRRRTRSPRSAMKSTSSTAADELLHAVSVSTRTIVYKGHGARRRSSSSYFLDLLNPTERFVSAICARASALRDEHLSVLEALRIPTASSRIMARSTRVRGNLNWMYARRRQASVTSPLL